MMVELAVGEIHMSLIPEYDSSRMYGGDISQNINNLEIDWVKIMLRTDHPLDSPVFLVIITVKFSVTVFFIRRWYNQWN